MVKQRQSLKTASKLFFLNRQLALDWYEWPRATKKFSKKFFFSTLTWIDLTSSCPLAWHKTQRLRSFDTEQIKKNNHDKVFRNSCDLKSSLVSVNTVQKRRILACIRCAIMQKPQTLDYFLIRQHPVRLREPSMLVNLYAKADYYFCGQKNQTEIVGRRHQKNTFHNPKLDNVCSLE